MKCPTCQSQNPVNAKFCVECGNKFDVPCPACGFSNSPRFKFCAECGQNLAQKPKPWINEFSLDEKLSKIQRYLPQGLTEKILSQRNRIEGERKQVTIMFCDMVGFTPLAEKLDPEETYGIIDRIYEILIHKVHDYEGTVNEMTGDGIMALFGAPIAIEEAPQRAIRSALAIHRGISRFSDKLKSEKPGSPSIKMRIGIHTGQVVVGTVGNDLRVEFTAVGDAVNLASRMEGLAEPGAVYVTGETFKITEGFFRFENLGKRQVKGRDQPVEVYRVISAGAWRTRFDVSAEKGLTPFVGRKSELELMLSCFEEAKSGRGRVFSIVSEAGMGKSRLLYEFRKATASEDVTFLEGKCLSYGRGRDYYPVIDTLRAALDVHEGDGEIEIKAKTRKYLNRLEADEATTLPYLLELLSVKESGIEKISQSPEGRKSRIMEVVRWIVVRGSQMRPLVLAIEDLHWIDTSSDAVLKNLVAGIGGARIFLVFTYRPEYVPMWLGKPFHTQVSLSRLPKEDSQTMASLFLGAGGMEDEVERLIHEKTEGVPFFIEEFIRSAKALGIIKKKGASYRMAQDIGAAAVPSAIRDVIMARVDRLPDDAKTVLQIGSAIEREFSHALLARLSNLYEDDLLSQISILKNSDLLYERGMHPQSIYSFNHALTQEVVYDSILSKRKKNYHERIANAIEALYKDTIENYYAVLAWHFIASENYRKAAEYLKLASKKAERAGLVNESIKHSLERISCLEKLPRTDRIEKEIIHLRTILGLFMIELNYFKRAKEITAPIAKSVLGGNDKKRIIQILTITGSCSYAIEENLPRALEDLENALQLANETKDMSSLGLVSYWLGCGQWLTGNFEDAGINIGRSEKMMNAAKIAWREATQKSLYSYMVYYSQGRIDLAMEKSWQAVKMAEESDDIFSKTFAYCCHGIACFGKGDFQQALSYLMSGSDYSERLDQYWWKPWSNHFLGEVCIELNQYRRARDHHQRASLLFERYGNWASATILSRMCYARAQLLWGEGDVDLGLLHGYTTAAKANVFEGSIRRQMAQILMNLNDEHRPEAERWFLEAIAADRRNGTIFDLARDYLGYGEFLKREENYAKASETIRDAKDIFLRCGADGWVKKSEYMAASFQ